MNTKGKRYISVIGGVLAAAIILSGVGEQGNTAARDSRSNSAILAQSQLPCKVKE